MDWDDDAEPNRKKRKEWRKQKGYDGYLPFTPSSPWNKDGTKKPDDLPPKIQKVKKPSNKPSPPPGHEAAKNIKAEMDAFNKARERNEKAKDAKLQNLQDQLKATDKRLRDITAKIKSSLPKGDRTIFTAIESVKKDLNQSKAFGNKLSAPGAAVVNKMSGVLESSMNASVDQLKNNRDTIKSLIETVETRFEAGTEKSLITNQLNTTYETLNKSIKMQTKVFGKFSSMLGKGIKGFVLGAIATESPMIALGLNRLFSGNGNKDAKKMKADALKKQQLDMDLMIQQNEEHQKEGIKGGIKKVDEERSLGDIANKANDKYGVNPETFVRVSKNEDEFNNLLKGIKEKMEIDLELKKVDTKDRKKITSDALVELREMRESLVAMLENDKVVIKKMDAQGNNLEQIKQNDKRNPIAEEEAESERGRTGSGSSHNGSDKKTKDGKSSGFWGSLMGAVFGGNMLAGFVSKFMGLLTGSILTLFTPATLIPLLARLALPALIITSIGSGLIDGIKEYQKSGDLKKAIEKGIYGFVETLTFGFVKEEDVKAIDKWADETIDKYIKQPLKELWKSIEDTFIKFKTKIMDGIAGIYDIGSKIMNLFNMDAPAAEMEDKGKGYRERHRYNVERMKAKWNPTGTENNNANRRLKDDIVVSTPTQASTELPENGKPAREQNPTGTENNNANRRLKDDIVVSTPTRASTELPENGKLAREQREQNIGTPPPVAVPEKRSSLDPYEFIRKEEDQDLWAGKKQLAKAYQDGKKGKSIGYGHFLSKDEIENGIEIDGKLIPIKDGITKDQADKLFQQDVVEYENIVKNGVGEDNWNKLTQNQKTALVSYAYNTGKNPQGIKDVLDKGDMKAAQMALQNGIKTQDGVENATLVARRGREAQLFPKQDTPGTAEASLPAKPARAKLNPKFAPAKLNPKFAPAKLNPKFAPAKLDLTAVPRADGTTLKSATIEYEDNMVAAQRKPPVVVSSTNIGGSSTNVSNSVQNTYTGPMITRHNDPTIQLLNSMAQRGMVA